MQFLPKLLIAVLLIAGCSREGNDSAAVERPRLLRNQWGMEFIPIPASGDDWKAECEAQGIAFEPISPFYMQRSELSRAEYAATVPGNLRSDMQRDIHPSQLVPSWIEAVKLVNELSSIDSSHEYRLPTIAEWRYAYYLQQKHSDDSRFQNLEDMAEENWEFAVKTRTPSLEAIREENDDSFNRESFVMTGSPPDHEFSSFEYYASPTPVTGDDGIDEYTGVRLVLVPGPRSSL